MLIKAVLIFLLVMVVVAMVGKALFPGALRRLSPRLRRVAVCPRCGRPVIGKSGCDCGAKR